MGRTRLTSMLATAGTVALIAGGVLLGTAATAGAAGTSLNLSSTSAGVTCDNSNPSMPVCSGVAGGDAITLAGTGFTPGSLASDIECNSDPHQPVILFLGNYIPISCTPLKISNISSSGSYNPPPFIAIAGTTGPVLNNPSVYPPGCTIDPTKGKPPLPGQSGPIPGCTTSGNPVTDAANFPCPPTAAQQAAGDDCAIAIGDQAGDRGVGVLLYGTETLPTTWHGDADARRRAATRPRPPQHPRLVQPWSWSPEKRQKRSVGTQPRIHGKRGRRLVPGSLRGPRASLLR